MFDAQVSIKIHSLYKLVRNVLFNLNQTTTLCFVQYFEECYLRVYLRLDTLYNYVFLLILIITVDILNFFTY